MRISCICPTMKSRSEWLKAAVASFRAQSWPDKELVIVGDEWTDSGYDLQHNGIKVYRFAGSTGAKRNKACELATGEIIAHWDDDDYSAPFRLSTQARALCHSGKDVTGYHTALFTDGTGWYEYRGGCLQDTLGATLMYRRDYWESHKFRDLTIGEDAHFILDACRTRDIHSCSAGDAMYMTIHAGNTSPRKLIIDGDKTSWRKAARPEFTC